MGARCSYTRKAAVIKSYNEDIEDLCKRGRKESFCPYYEAKQRVKTAQVVFMPYNYLLDINIRQTFGVELQESVIVIDEAHNLGQVAEQIQSFEISDKDLEMCIYEVEVLAQSQIRLEGETDSQFSNRKVSYSDI